MTEDEIQKKINEDPDFIKAPKFGNSLAALLKRHPDGIEDKAIAKYLVIDEEEVEEIYNEAIKKLKKELGIENE